MDARKRAYGFMLRCARETPVGLMVRSLDAASCRVLPPPALLRHCHV